jgi:Holliday junction resolvase RusA-like endonuclease
MIEFFVPGAPVPGGSKRAFPMRGRDGKLHVAVADDSGPRGQEWRAAIRFAAERAVRYENRREWQGILSGALGLSLWFFVPRPRGHVGKRGLLPSAPMFPTTRPDVLKLARGVEDACTGILWRDDAQIVEEGLYKRYADDGRPIGVLIRVAQVRTLAAYEPRATAPEAL